jgi:hypothetical protein
MRTLLFGIALGSAASTLSFVIGGVLAQEEEKRPRAAIIFGRDQYFPSALNYRGNVAAIGEELRSCASTKLHFVPSSTIPDGPSARVAIFFDEVNYAQLSCIEQIMKEGSGDWYIDLDTGPIELGITN